MGRQGVEPPEAPANDSTDSPNDYNPVAAPEIRARLPPFAASYASYPSYLSYLSYPFMGII